MDAGPSSPKEPLPIVPGGLIIGGIPQVRSLANEFFFRLLLQDVDLFVTQEADKPILIFTPKPGEFWVVTQVVTRFTKITGGALSSPPSFSLNYGEDYGGEGQSIVSGQMTSSNGLVRSWHFVASSFLNSSHELNAAKPLKFRVSVPAVGPTVCRGDFAIGLMRLT